MITQEKKRAKIYEFRVSNIKGIEVFEYKFVDGVPCVFFGDNGSGKSSILDGLYLALGGPKSLPYKVDNPVGPYSIDTIKKGVVDVKIKAEPGATELGEDLWIRFTVTESGTLTLKITDEKTGKVHTTEPRTKVEKLLGMFLDPVELKKTLAEHNGDRKLAEKLCQMVGLDLEPYVEKEQKLFQEFQDENKELKRQDGQFASLDKPQDNWAREYTEPAEISKQIENLNALQKRNETRALNISSEYIRLNFALDNAIELSKDLGLERKRMDEVQSELDKKAESIVKMESSLSELKEKNQPSEWKGTKNIEEQIKKMTEELAGFRKFEDDERKKAQEVEAAKNSIEIENERLNSLEREVFSKEEIVIEKEKEFEKSVEEGDLIETGLDRVHDENKMERWTGEVDPFGVDFPSVHLSEKMEKVTSMNAQYEARIAYKKADDGITSVKASIESINKKRKANQDEKSIAVAGVKEKFPHPGITVDENTVWVDMGDRRGKRTINDLSEGEKLLICTHILIAGNTGVLDVLIIRDGSSLDKHNRKVIYEIAAEYGYTVILETIETSENGALHIVDGKVESINQTTIDNVTGPEITEVEDGTEKGKSKFNW